MAKSKMILSKQDKKLVRGSVFVILVFFVFISFICFEYYKNLRKAIYTESSGYLTEFSKQMGINASKTLDDNYAILATISTLLKQTDSLTPRDFKNIVTQQSQYWQYKDIMLVDQNGTLYNSEGETLNLPNSDFLAKTVMERKNTISNSQVIGGKECIVFAIPVSGISIMDIQISAICASYELDNFDGIIMTNAFSGKAYTHIIDRTGSMIIRSNSGYADPCGYNLLSYLDTNVSADTEGIAQMKEDITKEKSGIISADVNGEEKYISYYPLPSREWCIVTFVPVSVVNERSTILTYITIAFCIFIALTMLILIFALCINFIKNNKKLEKIAFVDPITNGNTPQYFQLLTEKTLAQSTAKKFAMIYCNIEKFKLINDQFGRQSGNLTLQLVNEGINDNLSEDEHIARVMADHFCILAEFESEAILTERFELWHSAIALKMNEKGLAIIMPSICFGIYVINVTSMPVPFMIDRAKLSLTEAKPTLHNKIHYSIYDEQKLEKLVREKNLEDRMELALKNGEFEVYLQPKYSAETLKIAGAEALIRWNGPNGKMIYPDEFIPLFEQNGFIVQLDMWVFEQICALQSKWIYDGKIPLSISFNCSRVHLNRSDFVESYYNIFKKYNIPAEYLEVELTESIVYEDLSRLISVIDDFHQIGIKCSIDDFGSGYSSLNMIQDIPVDVLKLDKIFFRNTNANIERAKSVLGAIVSMAAALSMKTVAEGVELPEQVEMLQELGCTLIQGYVFAKPMPIKAFEELAEYTD